MTTTLQWDPPARGDWRGLHDHFPRALTPEYQLVLADGMTGGEAVWLEGYGFPVKTIEPAFVHGRVFISAVPLVGPRRDAVPPTWAMKVAMAALPALRRRARTAAKAVASRPWLEEARRWFEEERPAWVGRNQALADVDVAVLDDGALVEHLRAARTNVGEGYREHFRLHGCDLVPTGMLLARAVAWGLDPVAVSGLLAGSSPSSRGDERPPDWCLVTGYDFDERAAAELPARPPAPSRDPVAAEARGEASMRERVPAADRDEWDRLLADARATYGVRDSNGILTAAWPAGLLRRAMLEVGRRLVRRRHLHDAGHAVELTVDELAAALAGGAPATGADDAAARLAERRRLSAQAPPAALGPPQDLPVGALPPAMRLLAEALLGLRDLAITSTEGGEPLRGIGIGTGAAKGRARVAADPTEALASFEPGDIIVTAGTCPAWNTLLAHSGGVVTEEGGPLSHAAIIARELGLPAVIGCVAAMASIPDGATIELDVETGTVRVLER